MTFHYQVRSSSKSKKRAGRSFVPIGTKPRLGGGGRFRALENVLRKKGARNPKAVAAFIGRKKYGKKRFQKLAVQGKK